MVGFETQTVNSARVPPVSESYTITLWASTEIDNETGEKQANNEDKFDYGEHEFRFPEISDTEDIDKTN